MTVLYSHLVIVPTHPGRAGSRSAAMPGCPVAEPAVPPRIVTAGGWLLSVLLGHLIHASDLLGGPGAGVPARRGVAWCLWFNTRSVLKARARWSHLTVPTIGTVECVTWRSLRRRSECAVERGIEIT